MSEKLRKKVEIRQRVVIGTNSIGEPVYRDEIVCRCWARVYEDSVTIRYHPSVTRMQRVVLPSGKECLIVEDISGDHRQRILKLEFFKSDASGDASRVETYNSIQRSRFHSVERLTGKIQGDL